MIMESFPFIRLGDLITEPIDGMVYNIIKEQ